MEHIIHNVQTNTIQKVPYTEAEIIETEKTRTISEKEQALRDAKEKVKTDARNVAIDKLAALGLTTDDLKALGL